MTPNDCTILLEALNTRGLFGNSRNPHLIGEPSLTPHSPDLGARAAERIADSQSFSLAALVGKDCYRWVRDAAKGLYLRKKYFAVPLPGNVVSEVSEFARRSSSSAPLKAMLFALDASSERVATSLNLTQEFVDAFGTLFFNVLAWKGHPLARRQIFSDQIQKERTVFSQLVKGPCLSRLMGVALHGTMEDVLLELKCLEGGGTEADLIKGIHRKSLHSAFAPQPGMHDPVTSELKKAGFSIALEVYEAEEKWNAGSLHDPFLEELLKDSDNYNRIFVQKREAFAKERTERHRTETDEEGVDHESQAI